MIDFITVSRDAGRVARLEHSLRATFGSPGPWRLTTIDGANHDLFSGYNAGAVATSQDVLAFVHDDVIFLSNAIPFERPLVTLRDSATGFIGVAGSTRLNARGSWWGDLPQDQAMSYCRGAVGFPADNPFGMGCYAWPGHAAFGRVLVVDGLLLMCHRRTFERLGGFDGNTFRGFHFYDVDVTLRAHLAGLKNYVAPIPAFHASQGNYGEPWESARQAFVKKHAANLPCHLENA